MASRERARAFLKTPWFRLVYLALIGSFVAWMYSVFLVSSVVCLAFLVIGLTMFVVPYWFGERRPRRFLVNGLVIFAIAVVVSAGLRTQVVLAASPLELSSFEIPGSTVSLRNGTVAPFHGPGAGAYTFSVRLFSVANDIPDTFTVALNLTTIDVLVPTEAAYNMSANLSAPNSSPNTRNGTVYSVTVDLAGAVYGMGFAARMPGENWTFTPLILAPIAAPGPTWYAFFLVFGTFGLILPLAFYFMILFLWWYSARMRRTREQMLGRARDRTGPRAKPEASDGSKAAKATAFTCTNCGADVTEDASSCPKCGAVFED